MNIEIPCSRRSSKTKGGGLGPAPNKETYRFQVAAAAVLGNHPRFRSSLLSQKSQSKALVLLS